jgi:hypothetical protein
MHSSFRHHRPRAAHLKETPFSELHVRIAGDPGILANVMASGGFALTVSPLLRHARVQVWDFLSGGPGR